LQQRLPKPCFGAGDGRDGDLLLFERRQHARLQRGRAVACKVAQDVGVHQKLDHPAIDSVQDKNPQLN
jgi:hypothetical protein